MEELDFLKEQNVSGELIRSIEEFRKNYRVDEAVAARVTRPSIPFYGKEILEMAIAGLLEGGKPSSGRTESNRKKHSG